MKKNQVGVVLLLEGFVILFVFVMELFMSGGVYLYPEAFFDVPVLFCMILFVLPTLFATGAAKDFGRAFQLGKKELSIGQMKKALEAVKFVQKLVLYSCIFTMGVELIVVLHNMETPSSLGPNLAAVCQTFLYASILEMLLLPIYLNVQNRLIDAMDIINEEE